MNKNRKNTKPATKEEVFTMLKNGVKTSVTLTDKGLYKTMPAHLKKSINVCNFNQLIHENNLTVTPCEGGRYLLLTIDTMKVKFQISKDGYKIRSNKATIEKLKGYKVEHHPKWSHPYAIECDNITQLITDLLAPTASDNK